METVVLKEQSNINTASTTNLTAVVLDTSNVLVSSGTPQLVVSSQTNNVLVEVPSSYVVIAGSQGPQGAPGLSSEEEAMYSKRIDTISDSELYRGEAVVGSSEASAVWRIRKTTIISDDITEVWASGNANFDKVWADRLTYIYS